jgi:DNA gyrase/topoisomerase IV subunit B
MEKTNMTELKQQEIIKLSETQHILARPGMYCGSTSENDEDGFFIENNKFIWKNIRYVPALLKIINEVIDNSVDEAIRTQFKFANKIKVKIDKNSVTVLDNGRGLPIKNTEKDDEQPAILAFCHTRAGSNFENDAERVTTGMNGCGVTICNVFSTKFLVETADGKHKLKLSCSNNLAEYKWKKDTCTDNYTEVYFEPDLKRFNINDGIIPEIYHSLLKQRLMNLAMTYQKIKFYFNDEAIKIPNTSTFISMFDSNYEILDYHQDWFVAVLPNDADELRHYSFCNGLSLKEGGTHIQLISNEIANILREKISRKYKDIKPGDIRSKLLFVVFMNNFKNMKFDSQTKVKLTNPNAEINEFLGPVDWEKFALKIYKNEKLIDPIIETFKIKEEFKNRQQLKELNSSGSKTIHVEKYMPAIRENKYLMLTEGDSGCGSIQGILGRNEYGYFPLRGKPLNCLEVKISRIAENQEIKNVIEILGLDLTKPKQGVLNYQSIVFCADADSDGISIRALLLTLYYRFCPDLIKEGKIKFLRTPLVTAIKNKKIINYFFTFDEYNVYINKHKDEAGISYQYYKGLGTWEKQDLQSIIAKDGIDNFIITIEYDPQTEKAINDWMSKETSDVRKEYLKGKSFNIDTL